MILKNKTTEETIEITYLEFRQKFANEIETAFLNYREKQLQNTFYDYTDDYTIEFNFYFQLRFNFNHFSKSD